MSSGGTRVRYKRKAPSPRFLGSTKAFYDSGAIDNGGIFSKMHFRTPKKSITRKFPFVSYRDYEARGIQRI